jgi:threonine dehydratase
MRSHRKASPLIDLKDIYAAQANVSRIVSPTPTIFSDYLSHHFESPIYLKLENLNKTGSFKIRGATNFMYKNTICDAGVVATSAGNHAQGVAYVAKKLGVKARIYMPEGSPTVKVDQTRSYGAEVILKGRIVDDSFEESMAYCKKTGALFIHPFAHPDIIAGQASVGFEICNQIKDVGLIITPIGGGGLASGMALAIKDKSPNTHILGVQTTIYQGVRAGFKDGMDAVRRAPRSYCPSIADGIAVKSVEKLNLEIMRSYLEDIVTVEESDIAAAMMTLIERDHLLAEGAGAVPIAALYNHTDLIKKLAQGKKIVCVISGGNVDMSLIRNISSRGMIATGRLMKIRVQLADRAGELLKVLEVMAKHGANVTEVTHDRSFALSHYREAEVDIICETLNFEQQDQIKDALRNVAVILDI